MNTSACTMAINIDGRVRHQNMAAVLSGLAGVPPFEFNPVNMIIDSGSSCNIIPEATFRKMPGMTLKCCTGS